METLSKASLEVKAELSVTRIMPLGLMRVHHRERGSWEKRMHLFCSLHLILKSLRLSLKSVLSRGRNYVGLFFFIAITLIFSYNSALAQEADTSLSALSTTTSDVSTPEIRGGEKSNNGAVYLVGYGDSLTIDVWAGQSREKNLSGTYFVFASGHIEVPLLGKVNVGGKSLEKITDGITKMLASQYIVEPHVAVSIKEYGSQTIHVLGSVDRPGSFALKGPMSLAEAIANAQGTDPNQKGDKEAKVIRNDGTMIVIDLNTMFAAGEGNISLRGGDVVYVTAGHFVVVNGVVKKPGTVPWRDGMTITEAIAEAGGMQREANTRSVYIIRGSERIPVNVKGILQGKSPDIKLVSGDKVFVEQSLW